MMNRLNFLCSFFFFALFYVMLGCTQKSGPVDRSEAVTEIYFSKKTFDFGEILQNEEVGTQFWFRNTGKQPLVISNVEVGCGCTTAYYPTEPIAPGDSSKIDIRFNTRGREGKQMKSVRVFANVEEKCVELAIFAFVKSEN